jgi:hypothetical protein
MGCGPSSYYTRAEFAYVVYHGPNLLFGSEAFGTVQNFVDCALAHLHAGHVEDVNVKTMVPQCSKHWHREDLKDRFNPPKSTFLSTHVSLSYTRRSVVVRTNGVPTEEQVDRVTHSLVVQRQRPLQMMA